MAVSAARPERITPSLTIQAPLSRDRGPGLVVVSLAGTSASPGGDPQQLLAQEGYAVAHLKLSPSWGDVRIRDELREATESLDFYDKCSNKSRYGVIGKTTLMFCSIMVGAVTDARQCIRHHHTHT